ncbi:hypothetical protein PPYR_01355 [Photinus pyralis]|uniref:L-Fucosyltransferase n=1 Tax=Photinus pyralis TaxID=7054 RepID=A0A5N4B463_PHOPY|nr:galactoside 2-alpha-L-fucosyltransferase 2-like [Photinus pyralis]KAB0804385.1 hypothetical protein PPYR_01355 [Photinus pyralis]
MINANKNILFTATVLAFCVILFVHMFLFPLYTVTPSSSSLKFFIDFEKSLCSSSSLKPKKSWTKQQCPKYGVVTTMQGGRLGNQMWEYASVWAVARRTGLEPYIPRCIRIKLDQVFDSLSVPTFEEIAHCPIDMGTFVKSLDAWNYTYQSIVLPRYSVQPEVVLTWVQDIIQEFSLKKKFIHKSQNMLRLVSKNHTRCTFVGVHVRRTDYVSYLWRKYSIPPASPNFYYSAMRYFEAKYFNVIFIIVSDDPAWCIQTFRQKQNIYITGKKFINSPSLDLAILSSCNHSIIDYGTFGVWGAILAGGETIFYNISQRSTVRLAQILPNWHTIA